MLKEKKLRWIVLLVVFVGVAISGGAIVRLLLPSISERPSKCLVVPRTFILEHPDCAEKLLRAANITSVHIIPHRALELLSNDSNISVVNVSSRGRGSNIDWKLPNNAR